MHHDPIFGGAVKATEVRDHRSRYDEAEDRWRELSKKFLGRKLVRGNCRRADWQTC